MSFLKLLVPSRISDNRGFFSESYSRRRYAEMEIGADFVQDNHSLSWAAGTLRGLHFQAPPAAQAKLVRCGRGAIFDVAVDIRRGSSTYGRWEGYELTAENGHQLYVPVGFAHGFVVLSESATFFYKVDKFYEPGDEVGIMYNDKDLNIDWKLATSELIFSEKDKTLGSFAEYAASL